MEVVAPAPPCPGLAEKANSGFAISATPRSKRRECYETRTGRNAKAKPDTLTRWRKRAEARYRTRTRVASELPRSFERSAFATR